MARRVFVYPVALLLGALLTFSFAPYEIAPLAPLCIAVFYFLLLHLHGRRAFWAGWFFGAGYFGLGVNWVYHSLHLFGAAVAPLAVFLTLLFCLSLAFFPACIALVYSRFRLNDAPIANAFLFASLWALFELLRGKLFGGFPWILIGYSQTTDLLGTLAPFIGVYGIGFVVVLWATLAVALLGQAKASMRHWRMAALVVLLVSVPVIALLANHIEFSKPKDQPINVRLVQANIPQEMKFSQERLRNSLELYTSMTTEGLADNTLVVWPETAIPTYFDYVDEGISAFADELTERGVEVLSGGFHREDTRIYNSVRQLGGDKTLYKKRHLVPFGEFMPLRFLLEPVAAFIDIPMSDLSPGEGVPEPLQLMGESVGLSICYEDVYGEEMRAVLPAATLLVNVSNDAWFGPDVAPHQHEQKARMRARELARPMIRVTNTGISSAINYQGAVLGRIAHDTQAVLDVSITPRTGATPYVKTGNWPIFLLSLFVFAAVFLKRATGHSAQKNI